MIRGGDRKLRPADLTLRRTVTQRCGAYLALLALTLQFALSFGHVHPRDFAPGNFASATTHANAAWQTEAAWQRSPQPEATRPTSGKLADDEDQCPICFSGLLLATSFVPDTAHPPLSFDVAEISQAVAPDFDGVVRSVRAPFQSRAPPRV